LGEDPNAYIVAGTVRLRSQCVHGQCQACHQRHAGDVAGHGAEGQPIQLTYPEVANSGVSDDGQPELHDIRENDRQSELDDLSCFRKDVGK